MQNFLLIGKTLTHSYSKIIHDFLGYYPYELCSLPEDQLESFIKAENYAGLNVTIPYKKAVIPFLSELSPEAKKIGSVNTILRRDSRLIGYNTDYDGFLFMAKRAKVSFINKKVLILGSGGTSLTAFAVAKDCGAREIICVSRNGSVNYENIYSHQDAEVIINTTPVGMYPNNGELLLNISRFPNLSGVLDVIYNPLSTRLVLLAKERDIPCSGGLPMLAAQATKAAALFSGKEIPDEKNEEILNFLYSSLQNIVLIGMPGSGKSKIGKKLSDSLSRELLDTDTEIIKNAGKEIPEIFKESGESGFRAIERQAVAECGKQTGKIVATGGGVVLSPENYYSLAQNGRIYFLKRALYKLATKGRPLSKDPNTIKTLYNKRLPLYKKYSDKIIDNNRSANLTCQKIREDFYENLGS